MSICRYCGKTVEDNAQFCPHCGAALGTYASTTVQSTPPTLCTMALIGFILSFFIPIAGLIVSIIGKSQIKKSNGALNGNGFALAGIIISAVSMIISFIAVVAYFIFVIVIAMGAATYDPEIYYLIANFII